MGQVAWRLRLQLGGQTRAPPQPRCNAGRRQLTASPAPARPAYFALSRCISSWSSLLMAVMVAAQPVPLLWVVSPSIGPVLPVMKEMGNRKGEEGGDRRSQRGRGSRCLGSGDASTSTQPARSVRLAGVASELLVWGRAPQNETQEGGVGRSNTTTYHVRPVSGFDHVATRPCLLHVRHKDASPETLIICRRSNSPKGRLIRPPRGGWVLRIHGCVRPLSTHTPRESFRPQRAVALSFAPPAAAAPPPLCCDYRARRPGSCSSLQPPPSAAVTSRSIDTIAIAALSSATAADPAAAAAAAAGCGSCFWRCCRCR
eukprot:362159-Chlamydomonas_euryale.AAC.15